MKIARSAINIAAILVITAGLTRLFGSIQFAPWAPNLLISCASFFDIYGTENVEDFYMFSTMLLSLVIACTAVWAANRAIKRSPARTVAR